MPCAIKTALKVAAGAAAATAGAVGEQCAIGVAHGVQLGKGAGSDPAENTSLVEDFAWLCRKAKAKTVQAGLRAINLAHWVRNRRAANKRNKREQKQAAQAAEEEEQAEAARRAAQTPDDLIEAATKSPKERDYRDVSREELLEELQFLKDYFPFDPVPESLEREALNRGCVLP